MVAVAVPPIASRTRLRPSLEVLDADVEREAKVVLPVIDLDEYYGQGSNEAARHDGTARAAESCARSGAFLVKGGGMSTELLEEATAALAAFFALPCERKMQLAADLASFENFRHGYTPPNLERVYALTGQYERKGDPVEKFSLCQEAGKSIDESASNIWPDEAEVPGLRSVLCRYYTACMNMAGLVCELLADMLELPRDQLRKWIAPEQSLLRCLHYLAQPQQQRQQQPQMRMAPHTDIGLFTLLPSDPSESLEYLVRIDPDGPSAGLTYEWRAVAYEPGALLVHLGDATAFLSHERYLSKWHRVGLPSGGRARITLAFFVAMQEGMPMVATRRTPTADVNHDSELPEFSYGDWFRAAVPQSYKAEDVLEQVQGKRPKA